MKTVTIKTKCGDVKGEVRTDGRIFQGIPYATAERFEYPVPVTDFGGVFDATKKPLEFPQLNTYTDDSARFYTQEFRPGETFDYAESPLTLNIITPEGADGCPVLIYIHGGGFFTGKQSENPCGTSFEYAKRGVILVSISYRLNVFSLYRSKNFFLYDQLTAIRWVKDNIADYGGNPEDITLIGQSAGALSIFQLMYTDCLKGLVKGAVLMSGAGFFPQFGDGYTPDEAKPFWDKVMKAAGCCTEAEMKKVPAETLWRAWWETKEKDGNLHLLSPGIDGVMIPEKPARIKKHGKMLDIPLMVGVTSQDMMAAIVVFNMAKNYSVWREKRGMSPVYNYYFDRVLPGNKYKAYHASDLWYMFGNMEKCWRPWEDADYRLKDEMIDSVVRFINTGNPGWDAFSSKDRKFRHFNTDGSRYVYPRQCYGELLLNTTFERGPF